MKTGSERIKAIMRRMRVLFAIFVACMEDAELSKCVVFRRTGGGPGLHGGGRKKSGWEVY